jgi:hypothetical protein
MLRSGSNTGGDLGRLADAQVGDGDREEGGDVLAHAGGEHARPGEEEVADQEGLVGALDGVDRGDAPALAGPVHDVVVHQRAGLDQLDGGGPGDDVAVGDDVVAPPGGGRRAGQREGGAEALATAQHDAAGGRLDLVAVDHDGPAQGLLHRRQTGAQVRETEEHRQVSRVHGRSVPRRPPTPASRSDYGRGPAGAAVAAPRRRRRAWYSATAE